jgi:hypothetical protein
MASDCQIVEGFNSIQFSIRVPAGPGPMYDRVSAPRMFGFNRSGDRSLDRSPLCQISAISPHVQTDKQTDTSSSTHEPCSSSRTYPTLCLHTMRNRPFLKSMASLLRRRCIVLLFQASRLITLFYVDLMPHSPIPPQRTKSEIKAYPISFLDLTLRPQCTECDHDNKLWCCPRCVLLHQV